MRRCQGLREPREPSGVLGRLHGGGAPEAGLHDAALSFVSPARLVSPVRPGGPSVTVITKPGRLAQSWDVAKALKGGDGEGLLQTQPALAGD